MSTAGVVLAAGASRRMGRPKQLLEYEGKPLLEAVLERVNASSLDDVVVVLGAAAAEIQERVSFGRARAIVNPDHSSGMASSLRAGLAALGPEVDRAVVILGDQPDIGAPMLDDLLALQASSRLPAAALDFQGITHPPVVLDRSLWPDVMSLEGDVGCRAVIRGRPEDVARLAHATGHRHPIDVDTPEDYERITRSREG